MSLNQYVRGLTPVTVNGNDVEVAIPTGVLAVDFQAITAEITLKDASGGNPMALLAVGEHWGFQQRNVSNHSLYADGTGATLYICCIMDPGN